MLSGQERLFEVIDRQDDESLNEAERGFIARIIDKEKDYWDLSTHEKLVVNRIYTWLQGRRAGLEKD